MVVQRFGQKEPTSGLAGYETLHPRSAAEYQIAGVIPLHEGAADEPAASDQIDGGGGLAAKPARRRCSPWLPPGPHRPSPAFRASGPGTRPGPPKRVGSGSIGVSGAA